MQPNASLHGRLEDVHFPDLLLEISQRRNTGILYLIRQKIEKEIYFQDGRIVFAKSNDPDQRLGELLLRRGKVTLRQLHDAAQKIVPGVRLGTILVQDGHMKAADLYQGVIDQVEEIVYSVFEWSEGMYTFQNGDLPGKEVITLSISTPDIISAGIGRIWRWSWIRKGVGPLDTEFTRRKEWASIAKKMLITPAVQSLIEMLERPMSLEDILKASRINSYETCKLLWALLSTGIIEKIPRMEIPLEPEVLTPVSPEIIDEEAAPAQSQAIEAAPVVEEPAAPPPVEAGLPEPAPVVPSTEVISWQPRKLPPAPPSPPPVPAPIVATLMAGAIGEPEAPPTVEISFSDLADITEQNQAVETNPPRPSEPPVAELWKRISHFNEQHRYMFEMLRMEMGSGVGNFLTKILRKAAETHPLVFEGIRMNEFGELDSEALKASIQGNLVEDYPGAFQWLLHEERGTAAAFLDRKRLDVIDSGLLKIQEKQKEHH